MAHPENSKQETRKPAETEREWWAMLKSDDKSVIRSKEDWEAALREKGHPLAGCDQKTIEEFTRSLQFRNGGLAGDLVLIYRAVEELTEQD